MEYTQEQYQQAVKKAMADNNPEVAKSLAKRATLLYGPAPSPVTKNFGPEMAARKTLGEEVEKFGPEVERRYANIAGDDPSLVENLYRLPEFGLVAGSQAIRAGGATLATYLGSWIPNSVKEGAAELYDDVKETDAFKLAAQAASYGFEAYETFKQKMPAEAERFEAAVDITALFGPRPDLPRLDALKVPKRGAQIKADELVRDNKKQGVTLLLDPLNPEMTDVIEEKGVLRTKTWEPKDFDNLVIDTVTDMPGVKPKRSYTYNYRQIQKESLEARDATDALITKQNKPIKTDKLVSDMESAIQETLKNTAYRLAPGDIKTQIDELSEIALELVRENGADLNGVLTARRSFDSALNEALDSPSRARSIAARKIRGVLNDTLKANTSGDKLHDLLTKQYHGLTAMEDMLPKRNAEAKDSVARLTRNLKSIDLLPNTVLALAATGTVGLGAVGGAVPAAVAAGTGAALYTGIQLAKPRNAARAYAALLNATDKAINVSTPEIVEQLKLDRLILVDLLDNAREEAKEEPNE
jgi:hypothetical protein